MFIGTFLEKVKTALHNQTCLLCEQKLLVDSHFCPVCHEKLGIREPHALTETIYGQRHAASAFNPAIKRLLYAHKFHNRMQHISQLAGVLVQYWQKLPPSAGFSLVHPENVLVLGIPPHEGEVSLIDGFAAQFARHFGYDYRHDVLHWRRSVKPQHRIHDKAQRFKNLAQGLSLKSGIVSGYEKIIIVDDITTTGATLLEAVRAFQDEVASPERHGDIATLAVTSVSLGTQLRLSEQE